MPLDNECLFLVLQNRVGGGEDADKLVRLLAPQISQGKKEASLQLICYRCQSAAQKLCFLK